MISYTNSTWGIKRSTQNITNDIMSIITNANEFIIVGGYNFTFKTAGYTFFAELRRKSLAGIPVLVILPPTLYGSGNNLQTNIINFCRLNGIAIILNGNNHSKWILTDKDLYYGSSNFSETSWTKKVEVVTIHNHCNIDKIWKTDTVNDFKTFVQKEIVLINRRSTMSRIPGLIRYTRIVWNSIKSRMRRLNPSIEKVKITLMNYEDVNLDLQKICALWFETGNYDSFQDVQNQSSIILKKINKLCDFAYNNIFNESINNDESSNITLNKEIINTYNQYHSELLETIDNCIKKLEFINLSSNIENKSDNIILLNKVSKMLHNI